MSEKKDDLLRGMILGRISTIQMLIRTLDGFPELADYQDIDKAYELMDSVFKDYLKTCLRMEDEA